MADNTDEEHVDIPKAPQVENSSEKSIPTSNPNTINPDQDIQNMEIHKHPHHVTHKKAWGEYVLEFLMLFLAVFLGFVAENLREHSVEHQRAKQFARSLLNDLKADTAALNSATTFGNKKIKIIDSLFAQLELPREKWEDTLLYKYAGSAGRVRPFGRSSGTYEQMKASGSLRYFKQELADLLNKYDVQSKKAEARENIGIKYITEFFNPLQVKILEMRSVIQIQDGVRPAHSLLLRNTDKETISLWINYAAIVQSTQDRTLLEYNIMLTMAKQIMEALQKEYPLD